MPGTTRVEIRTLKVGRYVALEENAYKILSMSKSKPGKHGSAKARIELEDIFTGQKKSHVGTGRSRSELHDLPNFEIVQFLSARENINFPEL